MRMAVNVPFRPFLKMHFLQHYTGTRLEHFSLYAWPRIFPYINIAHPLRLRSDND